MVGSAQPLRPNITGCRPRRTMASATALGKLPPPQMMAIGPCSASAMDLSLSGRIVAAAAGIVPAAGARPHQRPLAAGADEGDDLADQRIAGELALDGVDAVGDAAF